VPFYLEVKDTIKRVYERPVLRKIDIALNVGSGPVFQKWLILATVSYGEQRFIDMRCLYPIDKLKFFCGHGHQVKSMAFQLGFGLEHRRSNDRRKILGCAP
jgi:hypothetical protein